MELNIEQRADLFTFPQANDVKSLEMNISIYLKSLRDFKSSRSSNQAAAFEHYLTVAFKRAEELGILGQHAFRGYLQEFRRLTGENYII